VIVLFFEARGCSLWGNLVVTASDLPTLASGAPLRVLLLFFWFAHNSCLTS